MTSIVQEQIVETGRPLGLNAVAIIFGCAAVVAAALAFLTATGRSSLGAGAFLVGGMETAGPGAYLLFAALTALTAVGLLRLAQWARWLAIGIAAWAMWEAVPAISSAVVDLRLAALARQGFGFIARGVIVWYFLQAETKDAFARHHLRGAGEKLQK